MEFGKCPSLRVTVLIVIGIELMNAVLDRCHWVTASCRSYNVASRLNIGYHGGGSRAFSSCRGVLRTTRSCALANHFLCATFGIYCPASIAGKGSIVKLGIDLGTYNSAAAYLLPRTDQIEQVVSSRSGANASGKQFPSFVKFDADGRIEAIGEPTRNAPRRSP